MVALLKNRRGIADALRAGVYAQAALPPATPWLTAPACGPVALAREADGVLRATVSGAPAARFALWRRAPGGPWRFDALPPDGRLPATAAGETLVLSALNAIGEEGPRATFVA
jgi:hypothetical protein